jgi:methylase of polypeptide subunit release factors
MALPDNHYTVTKQVTEGNSITLYANDNVFPPISATVYIAAALHTYVTDNDIDLNGKNIAVFGAGAGFVPIALKHMYPTATVTAYENDAESYSFITPNAQSQDVTFTAVNADVTSLDVSTKFDAILVCPPYLPDVIKNLPISHAWENAPDHVIFGGYKGFDKYKEFVDSAVKNLKKGGLIATLHSRLQKNDAADYLNANFSDLTNINQVEDFVVNLELVDPSFTFGIKK